MKQLKWYLQLIIIFITFYNCSNLRSSLAQPSGGVVQKVRNPDAERSRSVKSDLKTVVSTPLNDRKVTFWTAPIQQKYILQNVSVKIYYVPVEGKSEFSGNILDQPTNLESAFARVSTRDVISMRDGIYKTQNIGRGSIQFGAYNL